MCLYIGHRIRSVLVDGKDHGVDSLLRTDAVACSNEAGTMIRSDTESLLGAMIYNQCQVPFDISVSHGR